MNSGQTLAEQLQGYLTLYAQEIEWLSLFFLINTLVIVFFQVFPVLLVLFIPSEERDPEDEWMCLTTELAPAVAILIPAYNEEPVITKTVHALMALKYPRYQIIVINDGSKDKTLANLIEEFELHEVHYASDYRLSHQAIQGVYCNPVFSNLIVLDKVNGGKSDAINAGINYSRTDYFCVMDGDTILEDASLLKVMMPFVLDPDNTVAAGGTVCVVNGSTVNHGVVDPVRLPGNILALFQIVEYLRAFMIARNGWSRLNMLTLISGAFGIFKKEIAIEAGGYPVGSMGEDLELIMNIHQLMRRKANTDYKVVAIPEPVCWTEVPETWRIFCNQRMRWQQGAIDSFFNHWRMFLNPVYGRIGLFALPMTFVVDILGPITEVLGYVVITISYLAGILSPQTWLAYIALITLFGIFTSLLSLWLEERWNSSYREVRNYVRLVFMAIIENLGYRQICNLLRIGGWIRFIRKNRVWGEMPRKGF
ncbi:glycosyltransferase family 2 protein [Kistimonas scapharcae]|uniref:Glycosyltransferase family 2 protein n=1 Tax=Kistimonas scapharcae TaxID=1036133 RepID=A0ABP8V5D4_9GAMM